MPTINQLNAIDAPSPSDLLPVYSQTNGDARKLSVSNFLTWIQDNLEPSGAMPQLVTQRAVPSSTGFNVQVNDSSNSVWLILTPTTGFSSGTITLPTVSNCIDQQEVLVNCTQQVTTLTVNGNGAAAVSGQPTSLSAFDKFRLRFDYSTKTWYCVA